VPPPTTPGRNLAGRVARATRAGTLFASLYLLLAIIGGLPYAAFPDSGGPAITAGEMDENIGGIVVLLVINIAVCAFLVIRNLGRHTPARVASWLLPYSPPQWWRPWLWGGFGLASLAVALANIVVHRRMVFG
jgi:hypothetical protein